MDRHAEQLIQAYREVQQDQRERQIQIDSLRDKLEEQRKRIAVLPKQIQEGQYD